MFFNASDFAGPKISMEYYREWAEEISSSYLNSNCMPTDTLTKIAQSEELLPFQIEILAAEANKSIHSHKYANLDEKYFAADFPLADAKEVINSLQGGSVKVAGQFIEPKFGLSEIPDDIFGVKPEPMDKTAELKHQIKLANSKSELFIQKAKDQVIPRDGYNLYILKGEDEKTITELTNSGMVIGVIRFDDPNKKSDEDEVTIAVRTR